MKVKFRKLTALILAAFVCASCLPRIFAYAEESGKNIYDDCADFSKVIAYSDGLTLDVVTEENKYAFDGDDTHIIRVTSEAEWLEYEVQDGGYFVFNTSFSPNETISHFTFEYTADGEAYTKFTPIITTDSVDGGKWIPVHYSLKKLPEEAKYIRITFGNIGGTPWSPCIESVELKTRNTSEIGFTDCVGTKYYNATTKLKNLDLVNGYSAAEFMPSGSITRAEFCQMVAKLLNIDESYDPAALQRVFGDVDSSYWGAGAIYALYGMGIVNGDENGSFNPEDSISFQDAVKIMVSALGYTVIANDIGGYPAGFMTEASRLRLLTDLDNVGYEDALCRGDAAILMNNALEVEIPSQTVFGNENYYMFSGENLLSKYHGIYEFKGEVTDVGGASVYADGSCKEGRFVLGDRSFAAGNLNALPYLGMNATVYAKQGASGDDYTALYIERDYDTNVTELDYNDYIRLENNSIYYDGGSGREQRIALSGDTKVIYNYKYQTRIGLIDELTFDCGYLKIIANNGKSSADYVMIYDYETYVVSGRARLGGVFTDKNIGAVNLGLDSTDSVMLTYDGDSMEYSPDYMLNENDVVCVARSDDNMIADIRISVDTASGSVTNINQSDNEYTIGGKIYKLSSYFARSGRSIDLTDGEVTAYLDINGNIAYCDGVDSSEKYGYLKSVDISGDPFGMTAVLQIISESGEAEEIAVTSKSSLNGAAASTDSFLSLQPQLIKYTLRGDGTIAALETAVDLFGAVNNGMFTRNYVSQSSKFYDTLNIFASMYQIDAGTKIFVVPNDTEDVNKYEIMSLSGLLSDTAYNVQLFDLSDDYKVGAAVITKTSDDGEVYSYSPVCVVINSGTYVNEDGEYCLSLMVYEDGVQRELLFDTDGAADKTEGWLGGYTERNTKNGSNPFSAGEVLQYSEKNGSCDAFRMLLTKDILNGGEYFENNLGDYGELSEELYYSEMYTGFGTVENKFSDKLLLCANTDMGYLRTIPLSGAVYVYDKRSDKLTVGDYTDVEQGGAAFAELRFGLVNMIIYIRN